MKREREKEREKVRERRLKQKQSEDKERRTNKMLLRCNKDFPRVIDMIPCDFIRQQCR